MGSSGPTNRLKHVQERRQDVQGGGAAPRGIQQERLHQVQRPLLRQRFHRVLHPRLALLENSLDRHFLVLADDKKISKKEMNERILWKKNEVAEYEATTFSIFYNNSLFLALIVRASFYVLKGMTPQINYALS